jgi:hypothetical protein
MNSTDWEIHRLERAVVSPQPGEPEEIGPTGVPKVEAMLGIATNEVKFGRKRKQALDDLESVFSK